MILQGLIHKFGDNIDTDVIISAHYMSVSDPAELAKHCMEVLAPQFTERVQRGDLIVAGENFGCGSSREHAPIAIKAAGISCIIVKSCARIFYRNALNIGLPVLICPEASQSALEKSRARVELSTGRIEIDGQAFNANPIPEFMEDIINAGGLIEYINAQLQGRVQA